MQAEVMNKSFQSAFTARGQRPADRYNPQYNSLSTEGGESVSGWKMANVMPIYQRGNKRKLVFLTSA